MSKKKISFDLDLSNSVFKANLESLLDISTKNVSLIKNLNDEFIDDLINKNIDYEDENELFKKSSHLSNADWILLNSIFLSMNSLFEFHLFALARIVEDRNESRVKIDNLKGNGFRKYTDYLFRVGHIEKANRSMTEWGKVNKYHKARNYIAHHNGILISDPSNRLKDHDLYKFLKLNEVNLAGTLGQIRIIKTTVLENFTKLTSFLSDELTKEISTKYPKVL